jgi:SAM-dependent methyltransferase
MQDVDFLATHQKATMRDYIGRVTQHDKADCATIAKQWGQDYWDGPRQYGYGGYTYRPGYWLPVARAMAEHYDLKAGDRVLDVGCGKAFLLYELTQAVPGLQVAGLDISKYALDHAKDEIKPLLKLGHCRELPFETNSFDYVFSINTFHNLEIFDLKKAVQEVERVGKSTKKWICVESFRNEHEKANLLYWQLTCMSFYTPEAWTWLYKDWGYAGDYGFIYFE